MASPKRLTIKYIRIHISKQPTAFLSQLQVLISLPCCFDTGWYVAFLGGVGCIFKEGFGESLNYRVNYSFFFLKLRLFPIIQVWKKGWVCFPFSFQGLAASWALANRIIHLRFRIRRQLKDVETNGTTADVQGQCSFCTAM